MNWMPNQTTSSADPYIDFLKAKAAIAEQSGFNVDPSEVNPLLDPHQVDIVIWAIRGGRRAIFAAFGLGKSIIQCEIIRLILKRTEGKALIVAPLGVRQEFVRDAMLNHPLWVAKAESMGLDHADIVRRFGIKLKFIQSNDEILDDPLCTGTRTDGTSDPTVTQSAQYYLTNYESVRDGKLDPRKFKVISLDEAACLRGLGGSKTFREFMRLFEYTDTFRFVATALPSPNDYIELLAYAAFLDIMDVGQAKTRFFERNSEKADKLTLMPHKEEEFWLWVSTWAIFIQFPSDLGYSDEGYKLPDMEVHWQEVSSDRVYTGFEKTGKRKGQGKLIPSTSNNLMDAAREKRESLPVRIEKMLELRAIDPTAHRLLWHDLEDERRAIEKAIPTAATIYGSQKLDLREERIIAFSDGHLQELAAKPSIAGSGCNFQRHCSWAIFLGIGFKFHDFIQAIHRINRFMQTKTVRIDLIYTENERGIRQVLERKWKQHKEQMKKMTQIIKKYGLSNRALIDALRRSIGVERVEVTGKNHILVNNDCVLEMRRMEENSVHLVVTSIPFSTQYQYTPSANDFGHTDSNEHFWEQMDFLIPEILRVLKPGRVAAIHVKDRIVPGGINGFGFQTVYRFSDDCCNHFEKAGFAFLARKTIVTDVVRENEQTYRLGWTEQCKDGTRMGAGMPEYLLLFRKPPTDRSNGYADEPVVKDKPLCLDADGNQVPFERDLPIVPGTGYSRARWQTDAHGFSRSDGNRLLTPADFNHLPHDAMFRLFRDWSYFNVYSYEQHVKIGEHLEMKGQLPVNFMLLQPQSCHPDVWTDITRMLTLNLEQSNKRQEQHLCPMQFDIADRTIVQCSMHGETVLDPFAGLGTVPLRAVKLGRKGVGVELNPGYFFDACGYLKAAEAELATPSLFDLEEITPLVGGIK